MRITAPLAFDRPVSAPRDEAGGQPESHQHSVQFYESDGFLVAKVADYLSAGLATGDSLVVIATEPHRLGFLDALRAGGRDVDSLISSGQLRLLDARETLDAFMVSGLPDEQRFAVVVGGLFQRVTNERRGSRIRAYGEMVDLLWRDGNEDAAVRLEELWNQLQRQHAFDLQCAYVMANFYKQPEGLARVCAAHSHVLRSEQAAGNAGTETVRLLAAEIAQRTRLERALRTALDDVRRQANAARRSEEELRDFVENGAVGMHWVGPDGRVLWANKAELSMLGYDREEYVGRPINDFHVDPPVITEILERLKRREELRDFPARLRAKDGSIKHVVITSNVRWQDGSFSHTRCFTRDVTAERRLEDEHRASNERDRQLGRITAALADAVTPEEVVTAVVDEVATALHAASAGLWLTDADQQPFRLVRALGYSDSSRQALQTLQLGPLSLPALDCARTGEPVWIDSQAELLTKYPHLQGVVTPGASYRIACLPVVAKDRCRGALAFTFTSDLRLDQQHQSFLLIVARHAAQALERLRLLEENSDARVRAELLYELAAAVITSERVEQVFDVALDGIGRALGASRSSILTFGGEDVMRFRAWRGLSADYRRAVDGHSPWSRDSPSPEPILVEDVNAAPAMKPYLPVFEAENIKALGFIPLVASGKLLGKFMVYYDRPRSFSSPERQLAAAIANHVAAAIDHFDSVSALRSTIKLNELYAGVLAHDLRNPLAAIRTSAQLLLRRDGGNAEQLAKPLIRILNSGDRMARMVDQLLDFTRVRLGGGFELQRADADLGAICEQVVDELEVARPEWKIQLQRAGSLRGSWDTDRLLQLVSNLVANAGQHGTVDTPIQVTLDGNLDAVVTLRIHNHGAIPEAARSTLFDPLRRSPRRPGQKEGLGLGLFISRELAVAHGGTIEFSTSESEGTTFTVRLPRSAIPR